MYDAGSYAAEQRTSPRWCRCRDRSRCLSSSPSVVFRVGRDREVAARPTTPQETMDTRAFSKGSAALVVGSALVIGATATVACSDSSTEETKSTDQIERDRARNYYLDRVHVGINACVTCHSGASGPRFMAAEAEPSYATLEKTVGLISAPKTSPLRSEE